MSSIYGPIQVPVAGKTTMVNLAKARVLSVRDARYSRRDLAAVVLEAGSSRLADGFKDGTRDTALYGAFCLFPGAGRTYSQKWLEGDEHWYFFDWRSDPRHLVAFSYGEQPHLNSELQGLVDGQYVGTDGVPWCSTAVPPVVRINPHATADLLTKISRTAVETGFALPLLNNFLDAVDSFCDLVHRRKMQSDHGGASRLVFLDRALALEILLGLEVADAQIQNGNWAQQLYPQVPWKIATKMLTVMIRRLQL